jgi:hypothetical protein
MSKKFNKNLALIALTAAIALGASPSLADASAWQFNKKASSSLGWKLPTGAKMFAGVVSAINGLQFTLSHPRAASTTPNVIINTNASTTYLGGTFANVAVGSRLSGIGLKQADGSFSAQTVRLNPGLKNSIGKRQQAAGLRPFFGTIASINGSLITVNEPRGRSNNFTMVTVRIASSTTFATGTLSNLSVGMRVAGLGTLNADKSISALKINPNSNQIGMFFRGRGHSK